MPDEPRIRENGDGSYEVVEDDLDWDEFFTVSQNEYEAVSSRSPVAGRLRKRYSVRDMMDDQTTTNSGPQSQAAD